jgi:hypothetical protein
LKRRSELPPPDPAEELLKEWPELEAFGTEWVRKWLDLRERLIEIAKVLRRFPWMVEMVGQRPMNILHPYMIEAYVTRDGSEACLSLNPTEGVLRPKRRSEGGKAGTGVQPVRDLRRQVKRGIPPGGPAGLCLRGGGVRKTNLAAFSFPLYSEIVFMSTIKITP